MGDHKEFTTKQVRLWRYAVVSMTPTRDTLNLTGSSVVAENEADAWLYLHEAGGWRDPLLKCLLRGEYQMVPHSQSADEFYGSKAEWIQAVRLGYTPAPVRFAERAVTQVKMDRKEAVERERHRQRVLEVTRQNSWEKFSHWLEQQRYHPIRWKVIGFLGLGILALIFWRELLAVGVGILGILIFIGWIRNS